MTRSIKQLALQSALIILLIFSFAFTAQSQTIRGTVYDSTSNKVIPYANIALYSAKDGKVLNGAVSDIKGKFSIKPGSGKYYIKISVVGYKSYISDTLQISTKNIHMDKIRMVSKQKQLKEFVVSAERSYIEYLPGKQVINLKQDIANGGGNVSHVVKMVPSVEITPKGELSIRGNNDIKILINGREPAYGIKAETLLKQIPVSSVERIEVITNISAKDDPESAGGAINIILKENKEEGFHAALNAEGGMQPFRGNGGLSLSYSKGKTNSYVNYAYYTEKFLFFNKDKTLYKANDSFLKESLNEGKGNYKDKGHFVTGGFSYDINKKHRLNTELMFNQYEDDWRYTSENAYTFDMDPAPVKSELQNTSLDKIRFGNVAINYDYKGTKQDKLKVGSQYSFGGIQSKRSITERELSTASDDRKDIRSDATFHVADLRLDYERALSKKATLELGLQSEYVRYRDKQQHTTAQTRDMNYDFNQKRLAAYGIYTYKLGKLSASAGLRPELYSSQAKGSEFTHTIKQDYPSLFPNLKMQYKIKNSKSLTTVNLSYSKRIRRPEEDELDPAIDYSNPKHLRQGNIELKPEFIHAIELGWNTIRSDMKIFTSLFVTRVDNVIQEHTTLRPDKVLFTSYKNHDQSHNAGMDMTLSVQATRWWECMPSASFMLSKYAKPNDPETPYNEIGKHWNVKLNNIFEINPMNTLQVTAVYYGKSQEAFISRNAYYQINLGYELEVLDGLGTVSLSVSDLFNTGGREVYDYFSKELNSQSEWSLNNRFVNLGVSFFIK